MRITSYHEKLSYLNLGVENDFLTVRAAGRVEPDSNYRFGEVPRGLCLIEYIESGRGFIETQGKRYVLSDGDFVLLKYPAGEISYGADETSPYRKLWMTLRGGYIDSLLSLYKLGETLTVTKAPSARPVMEYLIGFVETYGFRENRLCHILMDLFAAVFRHGEESAADTPRAEQIRACLDRHIEKQVSIADIAAFFCCSERHIGRVFEAYYGISPYKYLRERRFAAACHEIRRTDELIYMISRRFCLGSPSFFASEFKSRFGMPPEEYRLKFRNAAEPSAPSHAYAPVSALYDYVPHVPIT